MDNINEILLICILVISLITIYITNKYLDKIGLIVLFIVSCILSYILSFKFATLSTFTFNCNAIVYVNMFTSLYLLLEKIPKKEVRSITNLSLIINIFSGVMLYIMVSYTQSLTDTIGINMTNVFIDNYRVLIAFPISLFISHKILILIYEKIKNIYDNFFISTVTTYLAVGLIESIVYVLISYYNILDNQTIIKIALSTYMIRLIITVIYSIFLLKITNKKVKK